MLRQHGGSLEWREELRKQWELTTWPLDDVSAAVTSANTTGLTEGVEIFTFEQAALVEPFSVLIHTSRRAGLSSSMPPALRVYVVDINAPRHDHTTHVRHRHNAPPLGFARARLCGRNVPPPAPRPRLGLLDEHGDGRADAVI